jgi:hypothetical protein
MTKAYRGVTSLAAFTGKVKLSDELDTIYLQRNNIIDHADYVNFISKTKLSHPFITTRILIGLARLSAFSY